MAITDTTGLPYRVVDPQGQGWLLAMDGNGGFEYQPSCRYGELPGMHGLAELEAARGPLRPVLPVTDDDEQLIRRLLGECGRKAVATLAAAIEQVFHELREAAGGLSAPGSYETATRLLKAGREGSNESLILMNIALFGNTLNLAKGATVAAKRAAGPVGRVDRDARDALAAVLLRWVTGPDRYTEVADTLAYLVSSHADREYGPGGWAKVADRWLQPGGLAKADIRACYGLLYYQSEYFDGSLI